jgi:hypothetical protein
MLVEVRKIWDRAPHNAFTDLIRFQGRWVCVFREGAGHGSHDGRVRVIASADGEEWSSSALLAAPSSLPDLRDPKISATPDGRLMLTAAAADRRAEPPSHQTYAWFSRDAAAWTRAVEIGQPNVWLWRVTWHGGQAYGVGRDTAGGRFVRLYRSEDGRTFETVVERLFGEGYPNEAALVFLEDHACCCLLRRDGEPGTAQLGLAAPPYTQWTWKDLGKRIGGPAVIRLADGRLLAAGRRYDGGTRTSLMWVDPQAASLREFQTLPSGGDSGYPGLVVHRGLLWVSYYASHEGKAGVHLAKVRLPPGS